MSDPDLATVQRLSNSSKEIEDSSSSTLPKDNTEPRFLLSGLNSGYHLSIFLNESVSS